MLSVRCSARARHVRLRVLPGGRAELVVPRGFDEREVAAILQRHEPWLLRNLEALGHDVHAPQSIFLHAIDEQWTIDYLQDDGGRYGCRAVAPGELRVSGGTGWQRALKRWLARKGRQHLLPWLAQVSEEVGLPYSGASIRGQRTRWGSCSSRRRINLNYALLFLPPEWVRYLFVHELCHTRYLNHSADYWRLVAQLEPNYRELDRRLRRAGSRLPQWLHADVVPAAPGRGGG